MKLNHWKIAALIVGMLLCVTYLFAQSNAPAATTNLDLTSIGVPLSIAGIPIKYAIWFPFILAVVKLSGQIGLRFIKDQPANSKLQPLLNLFKLMNMSTPDKHVETVTPPPAPVEPTPEEQVAKLILSFTPDQRAALVKSGVVSTGATSASNAAGVVAVKDAPKV